MDNNETESFDTDDTSTFDTIFSRMIKFGILIGCQIPSACCSMIIFYYFIQSSELRKKLHYHV